jgi:hypothetical protein
MGGECQASPERKLAVPCIKGLHVHHVAQKRFEVGGLRIPMVPEHRSIYVMNVLEEASMCLLVCSRHHRLIHGM